MPVPFVDLYAQYSSLKDEIDAATIVAWAKELLQMN